MRFAATLAAAALAFLSFAAGAQTFPTKTVRIIVPYAAGGESDTLGRLVAQKLTEKWKQPVVVESKPGGGTVIGTEAGAKADPDGHSMLLTSFGFVTNQVLVPNLPYDPASLLPQVMIATAPSVLYVNPVIPARTLKELIDYAKTRPKQMMFASSGNASSPHIAAELFAQLAGIEITHVPYKGTGPALTDLLGGQVHAIFGVGSLMPNVKSGKLRAITVANATRIIAAPDIPTTAESGLPNFTSASWWGIFVPAKVPTDLRQRIYVDIKGILELADMRERIIAAGLEPSSMSRDEFAAFLRSELQKWGGIIRARNIRLN